MDDNCILGEPLEIYCVASTRTLQQVTTCDFEVYNKASLRRVLVYDLPLLGEVSHVFIRCL